MVPQKWEPCRGSPGGGASPGRKVARETRERLHLAEQPAGRRVRRVKNAKPQTRQVIYIIPQKTSHPLEIVRYLIILMDMANSLISLISRIHVRKDEGREPSIIAYARLSNAAIAEHHQAGREVGH